MMRPDARSRLGSRSGSRTGPAPREVLHEPSRRGSRSAGDLASEDESIVQGALRGEMDPRAQRVQRAQRANEARMRSMYATQQVVDDYSDPWMEAAERTATATSALDGYAQPAQPVRHGPSDGGRGYDRASEFKAPKKPLLTEKQQNLVMDTLFGQAAPWVQTGMEMAGAAWQSDTGKKVAGVGGLALGAMLFPALTKMRG